MSTTPELTFNTMNLQTAAPADLRRLGGGVLVEMGEAFASPLSADPSEVELEALRRKVGPAAFLRDNIGHVQEVLGTNQNAVQIAQGWVERSGLLTPVEGSYLTGKEQEAAPDVVAMTDGVANWMNWRALNIEQAVENGSIAPRTPLLLAATHRPMRTAEREDAVEGMTAFDYMEQVIAPRLSRILVPHLVEVGVRGEKEASGDIVAAAVAAEIRHSDVQVLVASNAGAWQQAGGQMRRALRNTHGEAFDQDGSQLTVLAASKVAQPAGGFEDITVGNGTEPTNIKQNPFTGIGSVVRGALEMRRHLA